MVDVNELVRKRAAAFDDYKALADLPTHTAEQASEYTTKMRAVTDLDGQITRAREAQALAASTAQPVAGQEDRVSPQPNSDPYVRDKSLVIGGAMKMLGRGHGSVRLAREESVGLYGENHPVTRALATSAGSSGGFIVPPDYMNEIIELLRPMAVVRSAGPRVIPMPRGTMTLPGQASPATAGYGAEQAAIKSSQQSLNQIVATYKKLTAMVPVSNDMMRYADPAVDAFVRDDLVKVIALREDLAFLLGDGTQDTPRGYLSFANAFAAANNGSAGTFNSGADSVLASGGNFITSNTAYSQTTVAQELAGAVNRLDTANVPDIKRMWFMHPRIYNYLYNLLNALGMYVYRDELNKGTLLGHPFKKTTQIPTNLWDATGANTNCSLIFLVEMTEDMILDSMSLELAVSREGTYVDASGTTWSAFQNDQTLIRAITEHDHQVRHDAAIAVIQNVCWAPAIQ